MSCIGNLHVVNYLKKVEKYWMNFGSRVGLVVRALAFHHCAHVPHSIPRPDVILGLALFGLYFVPRGFFPGSSVFPSHQKTTFEFVTVFCRDLI